jgi:hypothetical protein
MALSYEIVSVLCGGPGFTAPGEDLRYRQVDNRANRRSPCQIYQRATETSKKDIIIFAHDDVIITPDNWLERVLYRFTDSDVGAVGLGGATGLGTPDLYRRKYDIHNMARQGYVSNMLDWQIHGGHETAAKKVAVLDAFFMAVRREFLMDIGGWPVEYLTHHCLDLWLACEVARHRMETWMVGVECEHLGGRSSVLASYNTAKWLQGGSVETDHTIPHFWLFSNYRDVLPLSI